MENEQTSWNLRVWSKAQGKYSRVRKNQKLTLSQIGRILKPVVIGGPKTNCKGDLTLVSADVHVLWGSS